MNDSENVSKINEEIAIGTEQVAACEADGGFSRSIE